MPSDQTDSDVSGVTRVTGARRLRDARRDADPLLEGEAAHGPLRQVGRKPYQIIAPGAEVVRAGFGELIPARPYCTDELRDGLQIRQRKQAISCRHIQVNGPRVVSWLLFDVDRPDARFDG